MTSSSFEHLSNELKDALDDISEGVYKVYEEISKIRGAPFEKAMILSKMLIASFEEHHDQDMISLLRKRLFEEALSAASHESDVRKIRSLLMLAGSIRRGHKARKRVLEEAYSELRKMEDELKDISFKSLYLAAAALAAGALTLTATRMVPVPLVAVGGAVAAPMAIKALKSKMQQIHELGSKKQWVAHLAACRQMGVDPLRLAIVELKID